MTTPPTTEHRAVTAALLRDITEVFRRYNRATDGTAVIENTYLQTVAVVA